MMLEERKRAQENVIINRDERHLGTGRNTNRNTARVVKARKRHEYIT